MLQRLPDTSRIRLAQSAPGGLVHQLVVRFNKPYDADDINTRAHLSCYAELMARACSLGMMQLGGAIKAYKTLLAKQERAFGGILGLCMLMLRNWEQVWGSLLVGQAAECRGCCCGAFVRWQVRLRVHVASACLWLCAMLVCAAHAQRPQFLTYMDDPANAALRAEVMTLLAAHKDMRAPQYELHLMADHFAFELKVLVTWIAAVRVVSTHNVHYNIHQNYQSPSVTHPPPTATSAAIGGVLNRFTLLGPKLAAVQAWCQHPSPRSEQRLQAGSVPRHCLQNVAEAVVDA